MSPLSRKTAAALEGASAPQAVTAADDAGRTLALGLTAAGPVGLAFDALTFHAPGRAGAPPAALLAWAERLAARATYLMEPLAVVEQDAGTGAVLVRSQAPTARHDLRAYYEANVDAGGTLRLTRLAFDEEARRRRPASCQMTLEVLERLVDDLVLTSD